MTYLRSGTSQIGPKHDDPWCCVREFLAAGLEPIFKQLDVTTTAVSALLVFDLILDNQGFVTECNGFVKGCRDSVVGSLGLCNETFVAFDDKHGGFFNFPFADV